MAGQLTPSFLLDVESRMRVIIDRDYNRLDTNLWWQRVANDMTSTGKRERLLWLLDTAQIKYVSRLGGEVEFDEIVSNTIEYVNKAATSGLKLNRFQLDDHDGGGVELATQWATGIAAYAKYWPQKQIATAIRNGTAAATAAMTYDGQIYFSGSHPLNPFDSVGTYANLHKTAGGATGAGACPIDTSVTLDAAFVNLQKVFTYIRGIKMANGVDPRFLRPLALFVPPALSFRAQQLTNAKFIAQAAATGGGSADIEAAVRNWNVGLPIECDELAASMGGSDTDYYVLCSAPGTESMGAMTYINREPFKVLFNGETTDAQLARMNEIQWLVRGRNVVGYGHPFVLHKVSAT